MFQTLYNRALLKLTLTAESPLLVKSGRHGADPSLPDMEFVRTRDAKGRRTVFIPGSSFKGVVRSHAERLAKESINDRICDPLDLRQSCGGREAVKRASSSHEAYREHCRICRLFGSTALAGRARFLDLLPNPVEELIPTESRTGVGIDRLLGSAVSGALFEYEVAPVGSQFHGEILVENCEIQQLGLLGLVFDEISQGFVRVGYGSSRGLGRVLVRVTELVYEQRPGNCKQLMGIGALVNQQERRARGLTENDRLPVSIEGAPKGLMVRWAFTEEQVGPLWEQMANPPEGRPHA